MQIQWAAPGILLLALGLAVVGCSGVREDAPLTTPGSAISPDGEVADPFVGMWDYDPDAGSTAELNIAMLMIDGPCVYGVYTPWDIDRWLSGNESPEDESPAIPLPRKHLLGLARTTLRFDHVTGQIWYEDGNSEPMSTGDYISYGGARRRASSPEEANQCSSTRTTYTPGISPWILPDWLREQLHLPEVKDDPLTHTPQSATPVNSEPSDPFIGMWDYDPDGGSTALHIGMLMIDAPCVYVVTGRWKSYYSESGDDGWLPLPHKYLLGLPRAHIRFDRDTNEIWFKDVGPMATGDYVSLGGSPSIEASPEEANQCSTTAKIRSVGLDPWIVPDWLSERLGPPEEPNRN